MLHAVITHRHRVCALRDYGGKGTRLPLGCWPLMIWRSVAKFRLSPLLQSINLSAVPYRQQALARVVGTYSPLRVRTLWKLCWLPEKLCCWLLGFAFTRCQTQSFEMLGNRISGWDSILVFRAAAYNKRCVHCIKDWGLGWVGLKSNGSASHGVLSLQDSSFFLVKVCTPRTALPEGVPCPIFPGAPYSLEAGVQGGGGVAPIVLVLQSILCAIPFMCFFSGFSSSIFQIMLLNLSFYKASFNPQIISPLLA